MATIEYVEDALNELLKLFVWDDNILDWKDYTILASLSSAVSRNGALTRKQAQLLLKILTKYQHLKNLTFDLTEIVTDPKWRSDFRKLDMSRSVLIECDENGTPWYIMKFPYALIKEFEEKLVNDDNKQDMKWCPETKVRKLKFYEFNIVSIDQFVREHNFVIDDSFLDALYQVEEIWQQQENIKPYSVIKNGTVELVNGVSDAESFFQTHRTQNIEQDLFLAKSMGFTAQLNRAPVTIVEKIAQESASHFWLKSNREFLQLYKAVGGPAAIILDRNTEDIIDWLDKFVKDAKELDIDTQDFKFCHRENKDSRIPLNDWIKENGLGGSIKNGKLFIFKQKPAKWLFVDNIDIKLIGTNSYTPINELSTMWWTQSHSCVCYISDIKPTPRTRNKKIAHL
jgi:hypothetical protein